MTSSSEEVSSDLFTFTKPIRAKIRKIELVIIGDGNSGKTSLAETLANHQEKLKTEIINVYNKSRSALSKTISIEFTIKVVPSSQDGSTQAISELISTYKCKDKSVLQKKRGLVFLCIPVNSPGAMARATSFWLPQLCDPGISDLPLIIVGTKADLKDSTQFTEDSRSVALHRAHILAQWIGAVGYVELSTKTPSGLEDLVKIIASGANLKRKQNRRRISKRLSSYSENLEFSHANLKLLLIGDGDCGKKCLAKTISTGSFPQDDNQWTPFEQYEAKIHVVQSIQLKDRVLDVPVKIWIAPRRGSEFGTLGYNDRLRVLSYPDSLAILLCFAVDQPDSPRWIKTYWMDEIKVMGPNEVPVILVGLKTDLRTDPETLRKCRPITRDAGEELARHIGAAAYAECSALTSLEEVQDVFESSIKVILGNHRYQQKYCSLS